MKYYGIKREGIIYEVLNAEVVVIDFNTGNYYALSHIAKQVWQCLERHMSEDQIVRFLSNHYGTDCGKVAQDVQTFMLRLLEEGLISKVTEIEERLYEPISTMPGWEYHPPELQKYMDVQDLLLLDPIHEVAEKGWPNSLE